MRLRGIPVAISAGILAVLLLLPATNWTIKNFADGIRYGRTDDIFGVGSPFSLPLNLTDTRFLPNEPIYVHAKLIGGNDGLGMAAYARKSPSPAAWAETVRLCELKFGYGSGATKNPLPQPLSTAIAAARSGQKLDPNNGFFSFNLACLLWIEGDHAGALRALHQAAEASMYDDYTDADARSLIAAFHRRWGYRGHLAAISAMSLVVFPQLSMYRGFVEAACKGTSDARLRWDVLKASAVLAARGRTIIDILVAEAMAAIALNEPGDRMSHAVSQNEASRDLFYHNEAERLAAMLSHEGIVVGSDGPVKITDQLTLYTRGCRAALRPITEGWQGLGEHTTARAVALAVAGAIFAWFAFAAVFAILRRAHLDAAIYPYLFALVGVWAFARADSKPLGEIALAMMAVILICAMGEAIPALRGYSRWFKPICLGALLVACFADASYLITAAAFSASWLVDAKKLKWVAVGLSSILLIGALSVAATTPFWAHAIPPMGQVVRVAVLCAIAAFPMVRVRLGAVAQWMSLAFALAVLTLVSLQLRRDQAVPTELKWMSGDGALARKMSRSLPPAR